MTETSSDPQLVVMIPAPDIDEVTSIGKAQFIATIGDGKFVLPRLHLIVYRNEDAFEAACLELGFFIQAHTQEEAEAGIVEMSTGYLSDMIAEGKIRQIIDTADETFMEDFWKVLRKINILNASRGNLDPDVQAVLEKEDRIRQLEKSIEGSRNRTVMIGSSFFPVKPVAYEVVPA